MTVDTKALENKWKQDMQECNKRIGSSGLDLDSQYIEREKEKDDILYFGKEGYDGTEYVPKLRENVRFYERDVNGKCFGERDSQSFIIEDENGIVEDEIYVIEDECVISYDYELVEIQIDGHDEYRLVKRLIEQDELNFNGSYIKYDVDMSKTHNIKLGGKYVAVNNSNFDCPLCGKVMNVTREESYLRCSECGSLVE